jgi:glycosyltransferase involved in cell wall biosynthesis
MTERDYSRVVVVIPALDEEQSLPRVLGDLPPVGRVIVADNGSTDRTAEVARAHGAEVVSAPERGYGSACAAGIARAKTLLPLVVVILDGDYSDYPEQLPLLVDPILDDEADLVIGNRTALAEPGALLPHQVFGNRLATALIYRITGQRYADMGPFRAIRFSSLLSLDMQDPNFGWNVEMQMKAVYGALRIQEVAVRYRPRIGVSKISNTVRGSIAAGSIILLSTWRYAR